MMHRVMCVLAFFMAFAAGQASAAIVGTTGSLTFTALPYPPPSNSEAFVFDEQQGVAFVATQPLNYGSIAPGTLVNSHYLQLDTVAATGAIGAGSVTFDGPILGIVTSTANLGANLAPDVIGTSDTYFGLENTLGPYEMGANPASRGLGSPDDDLVINIGSYTLAIISLEIADANQVDGVRIFTAVPEPATLGLLSLGMLVMLRRQ